jgi:hypothetical protein
MKTAELARRVGRSRSQVARSARRIPGHRLTRGRHHFFVDCAALREWISRQQERRRRGKFRKDAPLRVIARVRDLHLELLNGSPALVPQLRLRLGGILAGIKRRLNPAEWGDWLARNGLFSAAVADDYVEIWQSCHPESSNRVPLSAPSPATPVMMADSVIESLNAKFRDLSKMLALEPALRIRFLNNARVMGQHINDVAATLPGKRLTYDFYHQLTTSSFAQLHFDFESVQLSQRLARQFPDGIKTVAQANQVWPIFWRLMELTEINRAPP